MMEGECPGKLKITYEDSNAETVELYADFTQSISPAATIDTGMDDMSPDVVPVVPEAKKALLPTWLFVVIQVVVLIVAIFAVRKIVISLYKRKLRKQEEDEI